MVYSELFQKDDMEGGHPSSKVNETLLEPDSLQVQVKREGNDDLSSDSWFDEAVATLRMFTTRQMAILSLICWLVAGPRNNYSRQLEHDKGTQTDISGVNGPLKDSRDVRDWTHPVFVPCGCRVDCNRWDPRFPYAGYVFRQHGYGEERGSVDPKIFTSAPADERSFFRGHPTVNS
ncbi:hypothetical protein CYMTET_34093 [Cymbomonas tetramitiformis]|uniref:Uncharacterized protein n=1 Tax=Cymbomonas tetramitiformis TaxID=36881 RepID=A0AAE0KQJ7_9CHLO|nr:hypothetical protein CYMTET_34093 [Cymbomonas tetramitiformis]